ncbi:MAG: NAD(P)/FAD-dependent oxidoreductase [Proteobacteria bacterium]|nr:NAD(P)/FAD-dependent oxidoreductase [Pseudomonadota bacterium]
MENSRNGYDVAVIGTGMGGSACGALLAKAGLNPLILEKNEKIGGSCSYYEKDGFKVDIGTHMFTRGNRGPFGEVQRRLGIPNRIQFKQVHDLALMKGMGYSIIMPKELYRYPIFYLQLYRELNISLKDFVGVSRFLHDLAMMPDSEIEKWNERSAEEFVSQYIGQNQRLVGYLGALLGLFFVLPFWEASAGEAIWCYKRVIWEQSLSYPQGGAHRIPSVFLEAAEGLGADLRTGSKVTKIRVENGRVQGVEVEGGRFFPARAVVSTTSLRDSVLRLVGEEHFPEIYREKVKKIKKSSVAFQVKIALDRKIFAPGALFGARILDKSIDPEKITIDDLKRNYNNIMQGKFPEVTAVYAPVPSNFDPSLAPPGKQLITACSSGPTTDVELEDPPEKWMDEIVDSLDELIPGLKKHIMWVDRFDTKFTANWIGKEFGPAISTGQTVDQVGKNRPSIRTPIRGLYFAGDCAGGGHGVGTELDTQSGIECSEIVASDLAQGLID